jgi:putative transposase
LEEAKVVIEGWRRHYNTVRPHSSLGYKPPAPEAVLSPASQHGPASPATPTVAPRPIMN